MGALDVRILETANLGDRSYVVGDGSQVVVVDPQRDLDRLEPLVAGRTITHVLETHVHNDYVTGGLELARRHGAEYVVPAAAAVAFDRRAVRDGDTFTSGAMRWRAVATPGHTPHHTSYVVEHAGEQAVFTGGSLLYGSVGRTDLVEPELTEELTRQQWQSVRRLAGELGDATAIFPTHGFGSFCSATPTSGETSTIGEQRAVNAALTQDEERFVRDLIAGLDAFPAYYAHMGPANLAGPAAADLELPAPADPAELRRRIDAGEWVVDLRSRELFARGHLRGTLSFDAGGNLPTYLAWLIPWGTPVTLLGETADQVAQAQRELVRVGIDPAAQAVGGPEQWSGGTPVATLPRVDFAGLAEARKADPDLVVLDVRLAGEWQESHLRGARHLPIHELPRRVDELPDERLWVHCTSGFRAAVAASWLAARGREAVLVDGEFDDARAAGNDVEQP